MSVDETNHIVIKSGKLESHHLSDKGEEQRRKSEAVASGSCTLRMSGKVWDN